MAMTAKNMPYKDGFGPFAPEVYRVPMSYPYRDGRAGREAAARSMASSRSTSAASTWPRVVIEPIQGEGGFVVPAPGFLPALSAWCAGQRRGVRRGRDPDRLRPYGRLVRLVRSRASNRTSSRCERHRRWPAAGRRHRAGRDHGRGAREWVRRHVRRQPGGVRGRVGGDRDDRDRGSAVPRRGRIEADDGAGTPDVGGPAPPSSARCGAAGR